MVQATQVTSASQAATYRGGEDDDYLGLHVRTRDVLTWEPAALFTTSAEGLFDAFLSALPVSRRHHYVCNACRRFVDRFGGLVTIDEEGLARPALWAGSVVPIGSFFDAAVTLLAETVRRARVTGVFAHEEKVWGLAENFSPKAVGGTWHHLHAVPHPDTIHKPGPLSTTAHQHMAAKKAEHDMLCRGLAEFPIALVKKAHTMLTAGGLYRSEKCIGVAKWLLDVHEAREATKNRAARENLVWRAVASAPAGFCHVRSTMIATLLEDIAADKDFGDIKRSFDAKMAPTHYHRPQAPPTDGQLAAAEALVGKLRSAGSLARRRATVEEVLPHAIWTPKPAKGGAPAPTGEVFGHLKAKKPADAPIELPAQVITWEKFARTVLPDAERIECLVPASSGAFFGFLTAANPLAPPILQWDEESARNPVSWYLYQVARSAAHWSLTPGWCDVTAITMQPSSWTRSLAHQGDGVYLVLRGARDQGSPGLAIFPETLRAEYHGIRAAIEAFSNAGKLEDSGLAETAAGLCMQKSAGKWNHVVRVTSRGTTLSYRFDRWD